MILNLPVIPFHWPPCGGQVSTSIYQSSLILPNIKSQESQKSSQYTHVQRKQSQKLCVYQSWKQKNMGNLRELRNAHPQMVNLPTPPFCKTR